MHWAGPTSTHQTKLPGRSVARPLEHPQNVIIAGDMEREMDMTPADSDAKTNKETTSVSFATAVGTQNRPEYPGINEQ